MTSADPAGRSPILGRHRRARWLLPIFLLLLVGLTLARLRDPSPTDIVELNGVALGTTWFVKVVAPAANLHDRDQMRSSIQRELQSVDQHMSTWSASSELSRFNHHRSATAFPMSEATLDVFELSREVSDRTSGAFDVTVGPLVRAWGFGAQADPHAAQTEPEEDTLARLRERVGYKNLFIDRQAGTVRKSHIDTDADLSAVAKGYAVDRIAEALEKLGWHNLLVEVGGELGARGTRGGGRPWRVAVERPDAEGRSIFVIVELENVGMATSGDYRSFYVRDGVRLSHLIDPRTMRPVTHSVASVSVIADETARADALATGLGVLGLDAGLALAESAEIAAYFIVREPGETLRGVASSRFKPFLASSQPALEAAKP